MLPNTPIRARFSQDSIELTTEYVKLWMELFQSDSPELGDLHDHMVERVVMDTSDPPIIRIAVAAALAAVLQMVGSHGSKGNEYVDHTHKSAIGERVDLFLQIAAGERTEIDVTLPDGRTEEVVIEAGIRTAPSARARKKPPSTAELRWTFILGPEIPREKSLPDHKYDEIAICTLTPLITPMKRKETEAIDQDEYLAEWLQVFMRLIGQVLLCRHNPAILRRAYSSGVIGLFHLLKPPFGPTQPKAGSDLEVDAREAGQRLGWGETFPLIGDVALRIADGGAVVASLCRGDDLLVRLAFADGQREVLAAHSDLQHYEEADLVAALAQLQPEDVIVDETLVPPTEVVKPSAARRSAPPPVAVAAAGRPRKRPRPNEPCSCGSGRKYKKCCGER